MKPLHKAQTIPHDITPYEAVQILREGNFRFVNNLKLNRDLLEQMNDTKDDQWPFAVIVSCMDSRTSAELIFDLGLGDIFSIRIAGNIISDFILGSLEFATAVAGSKLIVVLGHTNCGAIKGACDNIEMGYLTNVLQKIHPAVAMEKTFTKDRNSKNVAFVNEVAKLNVENSVQEILHKSEIIRKLVEDRNVDIVPAMYNIGTGEVDFYNSVLG